MVGRRGRPPSTSRLELQGIALRLFADHGFENTTIEQIAAEAGVSERTFFRYFTTKASVLWADFDTEVATIRAALAVVPDDVPMIYAIRGAVVAANHYHAEDVPETPRLDEPHRHRARPVIRRRQALRGLGAGGQRVRRPPPRPARGIALPAGRRADGARRLPRRLRPLVGPGR